MNSRCWTYPCRAALFAAALVTVTGCGDIEGYGPNLVYPVRSDLIVNTLPKAQPLAFNTPGKLPLDYLQELPTYYDPEKKARTIDLVRAEADLKAEIDKTHETDPYRKVLETKKALLEEAKTNVTDPRQLTAGERRRLADMLDHVFGTPAAPTVRVKRDEAALQDDEKALLEKLGNAPESLSGEDLRRAKKLKWDIALGYDKEFVEKLKLDDATLVAGSKAYRRHCLHCHGLEGNGRGPTGPWVNPHPRDYRQGVFKFTSSGQELGERKPRRADLEYVLKNGIEGSSMPSFGLLDQKEIDALVSYVIHLSLRGELEYFVIQQYIQGGAKTWEMPTELEIEQIRKDRMSRGTDAKAVLDLITKLKEIKPPTADEEKAALDGLEAIMVANDPPLVATFGGRWLAAQDAGIQPDPYPYNPADEEALLASAVRGASLFNQGQASCVSCHKNYGREAPYYFDAWGTIVRPRNLVDGYYRGGRRPLDLYYRVYSGINGAGMTSYANDLRPSDDDKAKKQDKIWDLVNFMQALHYPDLRAKLKAKGVNIE